MNDEQRNAILAQAGSKAGGMIQLPEGVTPQEAIEVLQAVGTTLPKAKKVAIVGTATSTRDKAPFNDQSFEIWALPWCPLPRVTRLFDIHPHNHSATLFGADYFQKLRNFDVPVYMTEAHAEVPKSIAFPLDEAIARFGDYFSSTFAYMIALAIMEGVDELHIYGVDLLTDSEYEYQRPNAEYFIGLAKGSGINVYIPPQSALLNAPYRYGAMVEMKVGPVSAEQLDNDLANLRKAQMEGIAQVNHLGGRITEIERMRDFMKDWERRAGLGHKPDVVALNPAIEAASEKVG